MNRVGISMPMIAQDRRHVEGGCADPPAFTSVRGLEDVSGESAIRSTARSVLAAGEPSSAHEDDLVRPAWRS